MHLPARSSTMTPQSIAHDDSSDFPATDILYLTYEGNFVTECKAKVLFFETNNVEVATVVLDRTVLHAQGGGQPTDFGILVGQSSQSSMKITKVMLNRNTGVVTHTGVVMADGSLLLQVGETVQVSIDVDRRNILSECHTAGHVVDSAMAHCGKFLRPGKAYHFLEGPYVEYNGDIGDDEKETLLKDLQTAFCQLVDEDIPTCIELMSKKQADQICNRQVQNFDMDVFCDKQSGQVRMVTVAGYHCPCGGTHCRSTGQLKRRGWNITGIKAKKGVVRVKYNQNSRND